MANKLVYGVGINDADYFVVRSKKIGDKLVKLWTCPFYERWKNMLQRCYSEKYLARSPSYAGCTVCDEWLTFSNFKDWMGKQEWHGNHLDKDLLFKDNRLYSPKYCAFISAATNNFILDSKAKRGLHPLGVCFDSNRGKFTASCGNPLTKTIENLGRFTCSSHAHEAWRKRKHELSCQLACLQSDTRAAKALRTRYQ